MRPESNLLISFMVRDGSIPSDIGAVAHIAANRQERDAS